VESRAPAAKVTSARDTAHVRRTRARQAAAQRTIAAIYDRLHAAYRDAMWHWYPQHVSGPMDIVVGAILVQHTAWPNAERALEQLRDAGALDPGVLAVMPDDALVPLIRVSGTPTVKARRLRAIASTIQHAGGLRAFLALPNDELRSRLLATHGIGPETADAIMLYAAGRRTFVIDAYTRHTFTRIGLTPAADTYAAWQSFFEDASSGASVDTFQRYHAYIVLHGKSTCRAKPLCTQCRLRDLCATGRLAPPPPRLRGGGRGVR
jgi:endonuclease-3 related protein